MKTWLMRLALVLAIAFIGLTVMNASWLAPSPRGGVRLIAHGGVAQLAARGPGKPGPCAEAQIEPPQHDFIENTVASLNEARMSGAALIELDVAPTRDGQIAVFRKGSLDCLTDGEGAVREHTMAELKRLDAGYRYTPDGGKTFPLRGKGIGKIPTLKEYVAYANPKRLIYNFTSSNPTDADKLVAALKDAGRDPVAENDGFKGGNEGGPVARMRELLPEAWVFSKAGAKACYFDYRRWGWIGVVPESCRNRTMMVPLDGQMLLAGWPNRAIARLDAAGTKIIVIGPKEGAGTTPGLTWPEQFGEIPGSFNGYVWVDDIWNLGPALYPSVESRSTPEREAGAAALRRRAAAR